MRKYKKIDDCPDCKRATSVFCSEKCQRNYMARRRYHKRKFEGE